MASLRDLCRARGPFASAYFDESRDAEDAEHAIELRWRELRDELHGQGADEKTLDALGEQVRELPPAVGRAGRALVAAGGEVLLSRSMDAPPRAPVARWGRQPYLVPLAEQETAMVPYLVLAVDRTGAEAVAYGADAHVLVDTEIEGERHPIRKIRGAALSHGRAQHRVEETVKGNAVDAAKLVEKLVRQYGSRLVIVGGAVQARAAVRHELAGLGDRIVVETTAADWRRTRNGERY